MADLVSVDEQRPLVATSSSSSSSRKDGARASRARSKASPIGDPDVLTPDINKALRAIATKPTGAGSGSSIDAKEGFLMKKKRKSDSWGKYFFRLHPTGALTYSRTKDVCREHQQQHQQQQQSHHHRHHQQQSHPQRHNENRGFVRSARVTYFLRCVVVHF
jgi:hypothetical protein